MTNAEIAAAFSRIGKILNLLNENPFRVRAYDRAAETIASLSDDVASLYKKGGIPELKKIPGIGDDLAQKIAEMADTGKLQYIKDLEKQVPLEVVDLMEISGLGPKKTHFLWKNYKVKNEADLEKLLKSGKLLDVAGWGEKSVEKVLKGLETKRNFGTRMPIGEALQLAEALAKSLRESKLCTQVEVAGSLRRRKETVGDIDILVISTKPKKVMEYVTTYPGVLQILAAGDTKTSVRLQQGIQADVRVVPAEVFGAALHYFTGSKDHNVTLRQMALNKGLTISEWGVYKGTAEKKGKLVASRTEEDVYKSVGLPYIPPELREGRGEIEAAKRGTLPVLITEDDLQGDLHMHSTFSDGGASMVDMAKAAKARGFSYIAITDHGSAMGMVKGIKPANIGDYLKLVEAARKAVPGIHILAGTEVDIQEDGSLYLPDSVLKKLDWVVASVHGKFDLSRAASTARVLGAMKNPYVSAIGHPTGRILGQRNGIDVDLEAVYAEARKRNILLEMNASPERLDLNDIGAKSAVERGVTLIISSDAHSPKQLNYRYGIDQARRGWVTKEHVLNAQSWSAVEKWMKR